MADTLTDLSRELLEMAETQFPSEVKKFLRNEGNKLKKEIKAEAKQKVKKDTGNYQKGWKRGKPYKFSVNNAYSVRVYNASPHAHLVEYGHEIVGHEPNKIRTGKRTRAFDVTTPVQDRFAEVFEQDVDAFVDELLEKGLS